MTAKMILHEIYIGISTGCGIFAYIILLAAAVNLIVDLFGNVWKDDKAARFLFVVSFVMAVFGIATCTTGTMIDAFRFTSYISKLTGIITSVFGAIIAFALFLMLYEEKK